MKHRGAFTALLLLIPAVSFAANKEMEALQRDVALMQEDIRQLQRAFDQQMAALRTLTQQSVDNSNRTSTEVGVLRQTTPDQIKREMNQALAPVAGLSTRLDQVSTQVQTLSDALQALTSSMQQLHAQLTDLKNVVVTLQAPTPPPPAATDSGAPGTTTSSTSTTPPIPLDVLYTNANRDRDGGKPDLALLEYRDCIKYYHESDLAANCQFYIGTIHASRNEFEDAVKAFDAVLEQYPKGNKTADAFFYKGLALFKMGRRNEARKEFQTVIQQYPKTAAADRARDQMKALGFNTPARGRK